MVSSRFHILFIASVCIVAVLGSRSDAAVISSTTNQNGYKILSPPGAAVKVGTFSFGPAAPSYTDVRLRTWIELPTNAYGGPAPQLVLTSYDGTNLSIVTGMSVVTPLRIEATTPPNLGVQNRQSAWVSLTPSDGASLASIIASDSKGRIDAWLVSPTIKDFATPASFTNWSLTPAGDIIYTTITYTATLELEAVPEPTSSVVLGGLTLGLIALRRAKARRLFGRNVNV
jgi:hypothetical protein